MFCKKWTTIQWLLIFSIVLLIIKLSLLSFVHAIDADGITRVLMSRQWAQDSGIIKSGSWLPLYFYLMGIALKVCDNQYYTPLVVNIVLSVLTLFPLYFLMKRLFNAHTAILLCVLFSFSPIVFRLSLLSLSETPSVFFIVLAANCLAKGLIERNNKYVFCAGLFMSIAGGFRYESWIISPLVTLIIAYRFSIRQALLFVLPAFLFPLYWLISNYLYGENMLNSFTWASDAIKSNEINSAEDLLRRIWWYPVSLFFVFGPIGFFYFIKEIINVSKNRKANPEAFLFFLLFIAVFLFFLVNCLSGSLLMQHRFTLTLYLLSFFFLGFYFNNRAKHKLKMALLISLSAFALSFVYNSRGVRPIPLLQDDTAAKVAEIIKANSSPVSGLIVDRWSFENTYYVAFASGLPQHNIAVFDENPNSMNLQLDVAKSIFNEHRTGFILFYTKGKLANEMTIRGNQLIVNSSNQSMEVEAVFQSEEIMLYKYQMK